MSLVQSPLSLLLLSLLVLVSRPASCSTIALVEEGVYSRVTVRISEEVPRQFCSQIVQKVKVSDHFFSVKSFLSKKSKFLFILPLNL